MIRYTCKLCDKGRNAPERMDPDDMRRFCVECSIKTGKLVRVVSVKKERQAASKAQTKAECKQVAIAARKVRLEEQRKQAWLEARSWPRILQRRWHWLHKFSKLPDQKDYSLSRTSQTGDDRAAAYDIMLRTFTWNLTFYRDPNKNRTEQRRHDCYRGLLRDLAEHYRIEPPVISLDPDIGGPEAKRWTKIHLVPIMVCEDLDVDWKSEIGQAICGAAQAKAWADVDQLAAEAWREAGRP